MPYIGNTPAEKYAAFNVQNFTTSATTSYTLDRAVANELDIRLVINNVIQQPGVGKAYTAAGTTLTLSGATSGTDTMYAVYIGKAVQTVNPGAGSVGTTALADSSVTEAKLNVSNSPTNGYVLSAQSGATGGLTWAADAAGTITAFTNGVNNRVVTATSGTALNGEEFLTYNGTILGVGADGNNADLGQGIHIKTADSGGSVQNYADELVIEGGAAGTGMTILCNNDQSASIMFGDQNDNDVGFIQYSHNSDYMRFITNGSERIRILSSGGITFNGDTATANALDDYEEGSWTPNWTTTSGGSVSGASTNIANYVKVGNQVTVSMNASIQSSGTFTDFIITNLPFTQLVNGAGTAVEIAQTGTAWLIQGAAGGGTFYMKQYNAGIANNPTVQICYTYVTS